MSDAVSAISCSGLRLAQQRLAYSAHNVANVQTPEFEAQRASGVDRVQAGKGAGVDVAAEATGAAHEVSYEGDIQVLSSNTDLISETTEQLGAAQAFRANLLTLRTQDEVSKSLLDIKA